MKCRMLAAMAVLLATLSGAQMRVSDNRPELLAFKAKDCRPCIEYVNAYYQGDPRFRNTIQQEWRLNSFFDTDRPDLVRRYRVDSFPTFIVIDSQGREVRRVQGFTDGETLVRALWGQPAKLAKTKPKAKRDPAPPKPPPRDNSAELLRQIEAIRNDRDSTRQQAVAAIAQLQQRIEELQTEIHQKQPDTAVDTESESTANAADTESEVSASDSDAMFERPSADSKTRRGIFAALIHHGISAAVEIGVPSTAAEALVPLGITAGPAGLAITGGMMALKMIRRRRRHTSRTVEDHRDGYRTEFRDVVQVVDYEGRAWAEALKRCTDTHTSNPKALAILKQLANVAGQLIHGEKTERTNDDRPKH